MADVYVYVIPTQSGPEYFVEVDVVMPAETPLWKAHDLSQQLQDKIEVLPNVGRAFVHVDHETTHTPVRHTCRQAWENLILTSAFRSLFSIIQEHRKIV